MASINQPGTLIHGFSVGGNGLTNDQNIALSAVELEIRRILENENYNTFTRLTQTARNVIDIGGAGLAIYRKANRVVWGKDYNEISGSERQMGSAKTMNVYIDQILTIDFTFPRNDMERLANGGNGRAKIASDLANQWVASFVVNKLMELELIHLRAIYNYALWRYQFDTESVLVINPDEITDQQTAENAFYSIGERMVKKITTITKNEVGTNRIDWKGYFSAPFWLKLSRVYMKLTAGTTPVGAETLATGALYRDMILGTDIQEHIYLEQSYTSGTETAMNKDISFDLRGMKGFFQHTDAEAFPMSFELMEMFKDNDTRNLRMIGRIMFGIPAFIRGNLLFVIMDHEPTKKEIDYATSQIYQTPGGVGKYEDNLKYAFQLTSDDIVLQNLFNDDGSLNLKLNLDKGQDFIIQQSIAELNLKPGESIFVCNVNPNVADGAEVAKADYQKWDTEEWATIKDGANYYMVIGSFTDATEAKFKVRKTQFVKVVNDKSTIG